MAGNASPLQMQGFAQNLPASSPPHVPSSPPGRLQDFLPNDEDEQEADPTYKKIRQSLGAAQHGNQQWFDYLGSQIDQTQTALDKKIEDQSRSLADMMAAIKSIPRMEPRAEPQLPPPKPEKYAPPHQRRKTTLWEPQRTSYHQQEDPASEDDEDPRPRGHRGGLNVQQRHTGNAYTAPTPPPAPAPVARREDFKASEIGYFYPGMPESKDLPQGPYALKDDKTFYRNVHMFVMSAKRAALNRDPGWIAQNLHRCFRGGAMTWYACLMPARMDEVTASLDTICDALVAKYKMSHNRAFELLHQEHYTMSDAKAFRPADEYVQAMVLYGKDCDQSQAAVLTLAWRNLDHEMQRDVHCPDGDITADQFARRLDGAIEYWSQHASVTSTTLARKAANYSNIRASNPDATEAAFQRGVRNTERRYGVGQNDQNGQAAPAPYERDPRFPAKPQAYQGNRLPYVTDRQQQRQITANHGTAGDDFEEYDDNRVTEAEPADGNFADVEYSNYGSTLDDYYHHREKHVSFNATVHGMHGIPPLSCTSCHSSFTSTDEIDRHMLNDHGVDTRSGQSRANQKYAEWKEHAALHIVVIKPSNDPQYGYAHVQAQIFKEDGQNQSICIDTGSSTTFIDESLLPKGMNLYGMLKNVKPITVRGISGERNVDKVVDLLIFLNARGGAKVRIDAKAYVTKGIRAGVILGMDELGREEDDITLWLGRKMITIQGQKIDINFTKKGTRPIAF